MISNANSGHDKGTRCRLVLLSPIATLESPVSFLYTDALRPFFSTPPTFPSFNSSPFLPFPIRLSRLGSGLLGLVAAQLGLSGRLGGALGALDGRDTLDGVLAEVGTVARLGGLARNGLVGPVLKASCQFPSSLVFVFRSALNSFPPGHFGATHLRADLPPETSVLEKALAGLVEFLIVLVRTVSPPLGLETTPMACISSF